VQPHIGDEDPLNVCSEKVRIIDLPYRLDLFPRDEKDFLATRRIKTLKHHTQKIYVIKPLFTQKNFKKTRYGSLKISRGTAAQLE
jgi:hypothetical protein